MYNSHSDTQQITLWDTSWHILNEPLQSKNPKYHYAHAVHFSQEGLLSGCYRQTSVEFFLVDILVHLCTSYIDPPGKKLFCVRIVKFCVLTLKGFQNIVCEVQIDKCIITTTSLPPSMLIFGRKHTSLFKGAIWDWKLTLPCFFNSKPVPLLVGIVVEPSQTHGLVLGRSPVSFSIASNTYPQLHTIQICVQV